jgi:hypothetical protein
VSPPDSSEHDFADAMLASGRRDPSDGPLRDALRLRTTGMIRRRRRVKRAAWAAALLACYLAGVASTRAWLSDEPLARLDQIAQDEPQPAPSASASPNDEVRPVPKKPPIAASKKSRFEVLKRSGDEFLREPEDLALAVRGYVRALDAASSDERSLSPGDSWLLMALKEARSKEIRDQETQDRETQDKEPLRE